MGKSENSFNAFTEANKNQYMQTQTSIFVGGETARILSCQKEWNSTQ